MKKNSVPFNHHPSVSCILRSVYLPFSVDFPILDSSYQWNHNTWFLVTGFFHMA